MLFPILEKSTFEKILALTPFALLIIGLAYTIITYKSLPKQVPIHFDFSGKVTNYASKDSIWFLNVLGFALAFGMYKLMQYPHQFNYPVKITTENAEKNYRSAVNMMTYMNIGIALLFLIINCEVIRVATHDAKGFSTISQYILNSILIAMIVVPILQVIKSLKKIR